MMRDLSELDSCGDWAGSLWCTDNFWGLWWPSVNMRYVVITPSPLAPLAPAPEQTTCLHNLFLIGEISTTEQEIIGVKQSPNLLSARIHCKTETHFLKCKVLIRSVTRYNHILNYSFISPYGPIWAVKRALWMSNWDADQTSPTIPPPHPAPPTPSPPAHK